MLNSRQAGRLTPGACETPLHLFETLPGALFFIDDAETIVYANVSAQAMIGAPLEVLRGQSFWRGAPQLVSSLLYQAVRKTRQTQEPTEVEYVSPVTRNWLHVQLAPAVGGLLAQFHEMGEPARSRETFFPDRHFAADVLENMYVGVGCLTPEGILLEINEAPLADAQIQREEVIGRPFADTIWWTFYPASQEQLRAAISRASGGETVRFETLVHPREGMDLYLEVTITPHWDEEHHVAYLVYVGADITERKRAEQKLKESERNWRVLAETVPQLVWIERADGYVEYVNQRYTDYLQARPEQLQCSGWGHFMHPDDVQRTLSAWRHACNSGEPYEIEYRLKHGQTGAYRWFLARAMPVREETGQIARWFGTCTDIEEQKRIEEALRQSQERASVLMSSSVIGIFVYEGEQIVDANDTFMRMTGYSREDLRAGRMNWMHMTPPEDLARTLQAHQELDARQSMTPYEKEYICQDGRRLPVLVGAVSFQHSPRQGIGFVLDNAARKELERRKDDFINMASHELRTPLTSLKMQIQLVRKRLEKQAHHEAASALSSVEGPIKQLERLIGELLDVSKIQAGRLEYVQEPVDLNTLLRELIETMKNLHPDHTVLIRGSVQSSLLGDRDRLRQVFTNLLSNAIKYAPDAKIIEIDLSATEEAVAVRVRDHGPGIPRERRDKIFERFYRDTGSSRQAIPGLGMGLYIVAEIVKGHGGTITVESEIGQGSTFTVTLPWRKEDHL